MEIGPARKRLALWALIARTSEQWRRAERAMNHGIDLENATGLSVMMPDMDAAHAWAETTYGAKARAHSDWGML
jgi:hypothetical protein